MKILRTLKHKFILLSTSALALMSCAPIDILNTVVPSGGYTVTRNIAYGDDARQTLDIYIPKDLKADTSVPTVLFFYGGSWDSGNKEDYAFIGEAITSLGFIAVVADYRIYPDNLYPSFVEDSASAFVWVKNNIQTYGGNTGALFLAGHSAGAYNAAMVAMHPNFLNDAGGDTGDIRGVIGLAGPYDFTPFTGEKIIKIFSPQKDKLTQPITYARSGLPPMLLIAGEADETVLAKNSKNLAAALNKAGDNEVTLKLYPKLDHVGTALSLAYGFRLKNDALKSIEQFIIKNSGLTP